MTTVDFITFCHSGDAPMLHQPGQLKKQVESNEYDFDDIRIVYQNCHWSDFKELPVIFNYQNSDKKAIITKVSIKDSDFDFLFEQFNIDTNKPQYISDTDKHHRWEVHVVNHLMGASFSQSDYIVFADADCWIKEQRSSWVKKGIELLEKHPDFFIVSPGDGEGERATQIFSQQMFLVKREDFINADFNQPGWDGNPHVLGGPFPEYFSLLEGRMALYCKSIGRYRYVLSNEYRYWHANKTKIIDGEKYFEDDYSKW